VPITRLVVVDPLSRLAEVHRTPFETRAHVEGWPLAKARRSFRRTECPS
jgi:hypothetical protein